MKQRVFAPVWISILFVLALPLVAALSEDSEGVDLYRAGKYKEAETALRAALEEEPENVTARYYLGLSLLELKDYAGAEEQLRIADEKTAEVEATTPVLPNRDSIKVAQGRVDLAQKEYDRALADFDEAETLNPENPEIYRYRGEAWLFKENYAAAVKDLEKAIQMSPQDPYVHYHAGIAYSKTGRPDKMVDELQIFLRLAPDAPEARKVRSLLRGL